MKFDGDRSGFRYGKLTVVRRAEAINHRGRLHCKCDCGSELIVLTGNLKLAQSCGCIQRRDPNNPSPSSTNEYAIWHNMINRCHSPTSRGYNNYGARGIYVCAEWRTDFSKFLAHVGKRPSRRHSLDRINNELGYQSGNVRWATREQQNNNTRKNVYVDYRGQRVTFANAMKLAKSKVHRATIQERLDGGWPVERAFELPRQPPSFRGRL